MDSLMIFTKIMDIASQEIKSMRELCTLTGLSIEELKEVFITIYKLKLDGFWGVVIYDGLEAVYDLEEVDHKFPELEVEVVKDVGSLYHLNGLSSSERWTLYDLFKQCSSSFIKFEEEAVLSAFEEEYKDKYSKLSKKRIIKQQLDIFEVEEKLLLDLYKLLDEKRYISITLKSGKIINFAKPLKVYFNDDLKNWYLVYRKDKNQEYLRLDKITSVAAVDKRYEDTEQIKYDWGFGTKAVKVKLRVYNESNAKELAVRFLSRKSIIYEKRGENYFDLVVLVSDLNLFKRWLRGMGPHAIVLEPEFLREDMKKQIKLWGEIYGL